MKKKNILFILTDDQGAWTLNCGGNHEIQTPNLDKIAKMGMRFDNFFCASPVCSPARATIMTGEIPSQHGVIDWLCGGHYYDHATVEGGVFKGEKRYITDVITEKALEYLRDFSQNEAPFYLSVHYTAPHSPWGKEEHPDEFLPCWRYKGA